MTETGIIETSRLVLEPLRLEHAEACFDALQDPSLYCYVPQDPPASVGSLRDHFQALMNGPRHSNELWFNWFCRLARLDRYVAYVQATVNVVAHRSLLAYQTFNPYRNQGYASEACRGVMVFLNARYGVRTVAAEIDSRNAASRKLVTALGFKEISFRQKADYFKGEYSDEYVYQLEFYQYEPQ